MTVMQLLVTEQRCHAKENRIHSRIHSRIHRVMKTGLLRIVKNNSGIQASLQSVHGENKGAIAI